MKDQHGIKFQIIRYNNAEENKTMEESCAELGLGTKFEYTAVGTPQHNWRIERRVAVMYGRIRSM